MGKRIVTIFEILITVSLFSMFAALIITTNTNDTIIEATEEFVELVRYKGCITDNMYADFLGEMPTPVDVHFVVTRQETLNEGDTLEFTGDVLQALENTSTDLKNGVLANTYTMNVGDEIQVTVRKISSNFFDDIVGSMTGSVSPATKPAVAIKGGMILNTQYKTE